MGIPQHSTRTAGQVAASRGWAPTRRPRVLAVRDGRALLTLRTVTYVLASLTCLVILAYVVSAALLHDVPPLAAQAR